METAKQKWNKRFSEQGYAYGSSPNVFFKETLDNYHFSGKILLPAEGEGRNAVYAAQKGLEVTAIDISEAGKLKAEALAKARNVSITYQIADFTTNILPEATFDVAALIFAHFPIAIAHQCHRSIANAIKPGGHIIIECFSKGHTKLRKLNAAIGGPQTEDRLLSLKDICFHFSDFEILLATTLETNLAEGKYHNGKAKVIRFIGRKV